jgi:hypothetical protein
VSTRPPPSPNSHLATYFGVALTVVGLGLILLAWGLVAGKTQVSQQIPPMVSAGLSGLVLILIGVTVVNVAAKQRDRFERQRQMAHLMSLLEKQR